MSPSERDCESTVSGLKFSEALDMYLDARDTGPNESDDKAFYYTQAALRRHMDQLIKGTI